MHDPTEEELNDFLKTVDFNDLHISGDYVYITHWVDEEQ